ncbi:hypothetical protein BBJ28_00004765 [Nothophytophthora sp. Chile5]|nr:hypothetical protein BBJ28_00004765 [Nothophytophthora sp. Chile5]
MSAKPVAQGARPSPPSPARLKPFGKLEPLSASCPWAIFPRKKLDVTYSDIGAGIAACLRLREDQREDCEQKVTQLWDPNGQSMVTLSVRSTGFDLLLQTLKLPAGSEVLCSAITIPDMLYVLRYHGLVPIPVDLDPETLAVDVKLLRQAVTKNTRLMLIAHIFGSRFPLDDVLEVAHSNNLLVLEDCAQAFMGMQYTGESRVDVSMFSFGTIKTATSFGGAIIHVKDAAVLEEMRRRERRYERSKASNLDLPKVMLTDVLAADTRQDPKHAKHIMNSLVYLPVTPETPDWAIDKMMRCFREALQSSSRL